MANYPYHVSLSGVLGGRVGGAVVVSYAGVLGSQGSIVPVKENVHAELMIQSTGTSVIFVPLSSACASSPKLETVLLS